MPCALKTSSGNHVDMWISRLRDHKESLGFSDGPAISDIRGRVLSCASIDDSLHEILDEIWESNHELFPSSVLKRKILEHLFRLSARSGVHLLFKQLRKKFAVSDIDVLGVVNRWHSWDAAGEKRPDLSIRQHYTQYNLLLMPFIRYTSAM
jgi:hypothetical protein